MGPAGPAHDLSEQPLGDLADAQFHLSARPVVGRSDVLLYYARVRARGDSSLPGEARAILRWDVVRRGCGLPTGGRALLRAAVPPEDALRGCSDRALYGWDCVGSVDAGP